MEVPEAVVEEDVSLERQQQETKPRWCLLVTGLSAPHYLELLLHLEVDGAAAGVCSKAHVFMLLKTLLAVLCVRVVQLRRQEETVKSPSCSNCNLLSLLRHSFFIARRTDPSSYTHTHTPCIYRNH